MYCADLLDGHRQLQRIDPRSRRDKCLKCLQFKYSCAEQLLQYRQLGCRCAWQQQAQRQSRQIRLSGPAESWPHGQCQIGQIGLSWDTLHQLLSRESGSHDHETSGAHQAQNCRRNQIHHSTYHIWKSINSHTKRASPSAPTAVRV